MMISYKIICASGVLVQGGSPDFLVCIEKGKAAKQEWSRNLPNSTLRVQFFYPNRKRVSSSDIKAALQALENSAVASAVASRSCDSVAFPPARSEARTAGNTTESLLNFAVGVDLVFCQAGVVAPPDSLTGETLSISGSVGFSS